MATLKLTPNAGWNATPKLWTVLAKHVEKLGGAATITEAGLTVTASDRHVKDKDGNATPSTLDAIKAVLTNMYQWTVEE